MLILNDSSLVDRILNLAIRELVRQWFSEVCAGEPYDYDLHVYMIEVEPGGSAAALEEHDSCYEMIYIFKTKASMSITSSRSSRALTPICWRCAPNTRHRRQRWHSPEYPSLNPHVRGEGDRYEV
jgi:hypothetical protein